MAEACTPSSSASKKGAETSPGILLRSEVQPFSGAPRNANAAGLWTTPEYPGFREGDFLSFFKKLINFN